MGNLEGKRDNYDAAEVFGPEIGKISMTLKLERNSFGKYMFDEKVYIFPIQ